MGRLNVLPPHMAPIPNPRVIYKKTPLDYPIAGEPNQARLRTARLTKGPDVAIIVKASISCMKPTPKLSTLTMYP